MKTKLKIILPVLLVVLGGAYKFVLAKPAAVAKPKVAGKVYVLPKDFLSTWPTRSSPSSTWHRVRRHVRPTAADAAVTPPEGKARCPESPCAFDRPDVITRRDRPRPAHAGSAGQDRHHIEHRIANNRRQVANCC